jgi:hypothetical protein
MGVPLLSCFFATPSQLMHRMLQTSPQPAPLWRIRLSQGGQFSLPRVVYLRQGPHVSGLSVGLRLSFVALLAAVIVPLTPTSGRAQALFQCISGPNVAATSCGDPATASANGTTAIGKRATASGVNATALGRRATANDEGATAIGTDTTAAGTNASAFGINAAAGATGATAIGAGSVAAQTNSTAIGVGVASTRANQVIIGTAQQTITMPGVPNPASRAVQSGVVGILTTDENGNIATDNGTFEQRLSQVEAATANPTSTAAVAANTQAAAINATGIATNAQAISSNTTAIGVNTAAIATNTARLDQHDTAIAGLRDDVNSAFDRIDQNTQGIAIAIAMTGIMIPADKTFAIGANIATYDSKEAVSAQAALRLDETLTLNGAIGVGIGGGNSKVGARFGFVAAW